MTYDLTNKTVLLTGASSGIGHALALALAKKGARLVLAARRRDALERLAQAITKDGGAKPVVLVADLSKRGAADELAKRTLEAVGPVDVLINNAGVGMAGSQERAGDDDAAREVLETNYWSPLALIRAFVPAMRARNSGVVVNVSSVGAIMPFVMTGHYSSSKAALALATDTLRLELRGTNVRTFLVLPGPVETPMLQEAKALPGMDAAIAMAQPGNADVLARLMVRGIERGRRELVYPRPLWFARLFPTVARIAGAWAMRKMDGSDQRIVRGGSQGDPIAKEARNELPLAAQ